MKYIKPYNESKESIKSICIKYGIENYTINPDGSIDVDSGPGSWAVYLDSNQLDRLPLKFNKVSNNFTCSYNRLTSLEGAPKEVGGNFNCSDNQLTSLEGSPEKISGSFNCTDNKLTSVRGLSEDFEGNLYIDSNPVYEIFRLIETALWLMPGDFKEISYKVAQLLNEYDVISRDGKKIYKDSLEEVFNILGKEMPKDLKFRNYEIH